MTDNIIHQSAIVHSSARIGAGVSIGPFTIVEGDVRIGEGTEIESHVLLASGTRIGRNCRISHGAVLGTPPQDLKFGGEESELEVGDRTRIREFATLNRGTAHGHKLTKVGSDCMLMAYSHVAHDCTLGDNVIMANAVNLAGHVQIEDWVTVGGMTAVHQFVSIGRHTFIGGMARITQDVPPYALIAGIPIGYHGPNSIGLKRRGFSVTQIRTIRKVYGILYRSNLNIKQAVEEINSEIEMTEEVKVILDFIANSKRGITGIGVADGGPASD